jgi:hypothetical protein
LLLEFAKVLDLGLAKLGELFVELQHYFGLLSDKMAMERPGLQGFDCLSDDLII